MNNEYVQDYSEQERLIISNINLAREEGLTQGLEEGHATGLVEGEHNKQLEIAKMLVSNTKTPLEEISLCTGLTLEEIKKLKEESK